MKLYEPLDVPKPIADDLWIVDGPIVRMALGPVKLPFPTRMVLVRLRGGGLFAWSPTELSPSLREQVARLGPVHHLVAPNLLHYAHIAAWKAAWPEAVAWASPGVRERAASQGIEVTFERDLADAADPPWRDEIDQLMFEGSRWVDEVVFFHRASRTVIVADLIQNFERDRVSAALRPLFALAGNLDPDGRTPLDFRATFVGRRDAARASLAKLLAWHPERVLLAHGRCYERDGEQELRRAFRWVG